LSLRVLSSFKSVLDDNWSKCLNPLSICAHFRKLWVSAQKLPSGYEGPPGDATIVHDFSGFSDEPLGDNEDGQATRAGITCLS